MLEALNLTRIPESAETLRTSVKAFLAEAMADISHERRARTWMGHNPDFSRALAARGWVGMTLPKRYGGAEMSYFARFVVVEELLAAGAPVAAHWVAERQSGPLILHYGTEAQREFYLPRLCRGEAFFSIGMSEPDSGSDLASVKTRATKTDKGWVLNGAKLWSSYAARSHYMIALVRSSGTGADRHTGLSQFVFDLSLPGITVRPICDLSGDAHFSEVHFDNAEIPDEALIGREGEGWKQVVAELAFERSGPERLYSSVILLDLWLKHLRRHGIADDQTLARVGELTSRLASLRALSIAITGLLVAGKRPETEAALLKDMGTELEQTIPAVVADALAAQPEIVADPDLLSVLAYITVMNPAFSLRGGTREILRGMIARGLGLR
jgi:alkylation response protein AidB-like acyl-CoA dehydrogenase